MKSQYPTYKYTSNDVQNQLARFVKLDNTNSYPFDNFHAHEYNEIMVFVNGGGKHNINFTNYKIENNSIHLLAANDLHWVERSMTSSGFAIVYKDQYLHKLQILNPNFDFHNIFSNSKVINLNENETKDFQFLFNEIVNNNTPSAYLLQIIGALIIKIASLENKVPTYKIYDPIVAEVIKLVESNYKTKMTLTGYAQALNLELRTLQNRFNKATSTTITELIQQRILKEAKKLLCTESKSVGEIADELGFKETAHFTNWFKKKTKYNPSEYKYENENRVGR